MHRFNPIYKKKWVRECELARSCPGHVLNHGHHFKLSITWHKPQMDTLRTCAPLIFSPHPKRIVVSFGQKQLVQRGPSRWKRRRWRDSAVWKEYTDAQKKGMAYDVAKQCKTYMINVRVCVCARAQGARQHPCPMSLTYLNLTRLTRTGEVRQT